MLTLAFKDKSRMRIGLPDGREVWVAVDFNNLHLADNGRAPEIKLSIDAPRDIQIDREEVHLSKCQKERTKKTGT